MLFIRKGVRNNSIDKELITLEQHHKTHYGSTNNTIQTIYVYILKSFF